MLMLAPPLIKPFYIYRPSKMYVNSSYDFVENEDDGDVFEREPFNVLFYSDQTG